VTAQGDIVEVRSTTSGGAAGKTEIFAQALPNPRGIVVSGDSVYVAVDDGIIRLRDVNSDGIADQREYLSKAVEPAPGPQGAPVLGPDGQIYVSGRLLPNGTNRVVTVTSTEGVTTLASHALTKPGALVVKQNELYAVAQAADGTSTLYSMSILSGGALGPPSAPVAKFASDVTVNKVFILDSAFGPQGVVGTILAEVSDGGHGKIVSLAPSLSDLLPDVVDFSTGLGQPDDLVVGLDGSVYVADAANQEVVKIVTPIQPSP
jgi:hypothetical protein